MGDDFERDGHAEHRDRKISELGRDRPGGTQAKKLTSQTEEKVDIVPEGTRPLHRSVFGIGPDPQIRGHPPPGLVELAPPTHRGFRRRHQVLLVSQVAGHPSQETSQVPPILPRELTAEDLHVKFNLSPPLLSRSSQPIYRPALGLDCHSRSLGEFYEESLPHI